MSRPPFAPTGPDNDAPPMPESGRRRLLGLPLAALAGAALPAAVALAAASPRGAHAAGLPDVVAAAKPSIVAIGLYAPLQNPQFRFLGSGFAVGDGKRVVTCAHVIPTIDPGKRESVAIAVPGSEKTRVYQARLGVLDRDADLAVLEFEGPSLPALPLADAAEIREGSDVLLMGFPIGSALGLFPAAHRGVISAVTPLIVPAANSAGLRAENVQVMRGKPIQLLQLDATTFPGNSGGPLIDVGTGRVVGVISLGVSKGTRESALQYPSGISYAVPVGYVSPLVKVR